MTMNSTVCAFYQDGKPARNKKVEISISAGLLGGGMVKGFTDSTGCANFSHSSRGAAKIYVGGSQLGSFSVPGRTTVTIS